MKSSLIYINIKISPCLEHNWCSKDSTSKNIRDFLTKDCDNCKLVSVNYSSQ